MSTLDSTTPVRRSAVAVLLIAAAFVAWLVLFDSRRSQGNASAIERIAVNADDPRAAFAVFKDPADGVDESDVKILRNFGEIHKVDPSQARRISVSWSSGSGYIVPGPDRLCVAIPFPDGPAFGVNCSTTQQALDGELIGALRVPGGGAYVMQVVPNGVTQVAVGDGKAQTVPARGNVAAFEARVGDRSTYASPNGSHSEEVPGR